MAHHHVPHHDVESGFGLGITMTTRRNETNDVIIFCDVFGDKFSQLGNNYYVFFFKLQISKKISKILIKYIFWMKSLSHSNYIFNQR
jgi:hypothetical protein